METIGERIKQLRLRLGLTQAEFGSLFHVSKQAVHSWENNINMPDVASLIEIADYGRIPVCTLLGYPHEYCQLRDAKKIKDPKTDYQPFSGREIRLINRFRTLSSAQQKAMEVILGIRND